MAKKSLRVVTASEDIAKIVDQGSAISRKLKELTGSDKAIKAQLGDVAMGFLGYGETGVRLNGTEASAAVSFATKNSLDIKAGGFPGVKDAVTAGLLDGVVSKKLNLLVPQDAVQRAADILTDAGIPASVMTTFDLDSVALNAALAAEVSSPQKLTAVTKVKNCVTSKTTTRVAYGDVEE